MRQYYPQIAACKKCAIGTRNVEEEVIKEETVTEEPVE
jgi:hypothetical protein